MIEFRTFGTSDFKSICLSLKSNKKNLLLLVLSRNKHGKILTEKKATKSEAFKKGIKREWVS